MTFAVITIGSKQYKVAPKEKLVVDRLDSKEGKDVTLGGVLLFVKNKTVRVGTPRVTGARVKARVIRHMRGEKLIVFKYKAKKRYKKKKGARAHLTELEILDISLAKRTTTKPVKTKTTKKP